MPRFLALTSRGLIEPLASELKELDVKVKARPDAVEVDCSWADLYRVHLLSRLATRFLQPVGEFVAYNENDLYYGILRHYDFSQCILPNQTLRVEAHVRDHNKLRDQRFVAMKVKDAVVDQFRKKFDARPSVGDDKTADLKIVARVVGTRVSIAIDLTGDTLSNRGYRRFSGPAPLRENVAAGLLRLAQWTSPAPLVDPFCGTGTILIEAALIASGVVQVQRRCSFAFERLKSFHPEAWRQVNQPARRKAAPDKPFLFGYDKDAAVLESARANARAAGVENWIRFQQKDVRDLQMPQIPEGAGPGLIITNPPYGERLESAPQVKELMGHFSQTLKTRFKGWDAWILSGNRDASVGLRLKAARRIPVWNGPIDCRLLHYPLA